MPIQRIFVVVRRREIRAAPRRVEPRVPRAICHFGREGPCVLAIGHQHQNLESGVICGGRAIIVIHRVRGHGRPRLPLVYQGLSDGPGRGVKQCQPPTCADIDRGVAARLERLDLGNDRALVVFKSQNGGEGVIGAVFNARLAAQIEVVSPIVEAVAIHRALQCGAGRDRQGGKAQRLDVHAGILGVIRVEVVDPPQRGAQCHLLVIGHDRDREAPGRCAGWLNVVKQFLDEVFGCGLQTIHAGRGTRNPVIHRPRNIEHHRDLDIADRFLCLRRDVRFQRFDADKIPEDRGHGVADLGRHAAIFVVIPLFDDRGHLEIAHAGLGDIVVNHGLGIQALVQIRRSQGSAVERGLNDRAPFLLAHEVNRDAQHDQHDDQQLQAEDNECTLFISCKLTEPANLTVGACCDLVADMQFHHSYSLPAGRPLATTRRDGCLQGSKLANALGGIKAGLGRRYSDCARFGCNRGFAPLWFPMCIQFAAFCSRFGKVCAGRSANVALSDLMAGPIANRWIWCKALSTPRAWRPI